MLSDDNRQQVLGEIKAAAPRLVRLARSESMTGDLLERVLALNDEVRSVLDENGIAYSVSPEPTPAADTLTRKSETPKPESDKCVIDETIHCESINIFGKRYVRILNHSDKVVHNISIKSDDKQIVAADFLPPDETLTARTSNVDPISVFVDDSLVCTL